MEKRKKFAKIFGRDPRDVAQVKKVGFATTDRVHSQKAITFFHPIRT